MLPLKNRESHATSQAMLWVTPRHQPKEGTLWARLRVDTHIHVTDTQAADLDVCHSETTPMAGLQDPTARYTQTGKARIMRVGSSSLSSWLCSSYTRYALEAQSPRAWISVCLGVSLNARVAPPRRKLCPA